MSHALIPGSSTAPLSSPIKLRRSRVLTNYIKSPSPKKRTKEGHCQFCNLNFDTAEKLEGHLQQSYHCCSLYLRNYKVKSIEPILVSMFGCMFCKTGGASVKLSFHLSRNPQCKNKYFQRFNVSTKEDLLKLVESLKRKMRPSRNRVSRNLENSKRKEKSKNTTAEHKTASELLNLFRRDTEFSNVKLCIDCQKNIISHGDVLTIGDLEKEVDIALDDMMKFRRFQLFFRCKSCSDKENANFEAKIAISLFSDDVKTVFAPDDFLLQGGLTSNEIGETLTVICLFPASSEALKIVPSQGIKSRSRDAGVMYKLNPPIKDVVSIAYENELYKFKMAKMLSDRYHGVEKQGVDNILSSIEKVSKEHKIIGSETWQRNEKDLTLHKLDQNGAFCLTIDIELPVQDDVIASCLIQSGVVVSVRYTGKSTSEQERKYFIHNHLSHQDCDISCEEQELKDYLPGILDLDTINTKFLTTHLSSVQIKISSFIRNFLKDPSSDIHSEAYSLKLKYGLDGKIGVTGYIWPKQFNELNYQFASYPRNPIDAEVQRNTLEYIDSIISTSTNSSTIASQFNMSELEGQKLADLVKEVQEHDCDRTNCKYCENLCLPALKTAFIQCPEPDYHQNISAALQYRRVMTQKLLSTSPGQVNSLSTEEWIRDVSRTFNDDAWEENGKRKWKIEVGMDSIQFLIDKRLLDLTGEYPDDPEFALYQYCLTCSSLEDSFQVVLKTVFVRDTFTQPYNKNLIMAFQSKQEVSPVCGYSKEEKFVENISHHPDVEGLDDSFRMCHREVSLAECYSLLEKNMHRSFNSTSSDYIPAFKERKTYFKKVDSESDNTFKVEGTSGFYEKQSSIIDKYYSRRKVEHITLYELCAYYDYIGKEESRQALKIFSSDKEVTIGDSEFSSVFDPNLKLPELILTNKDEVMKIRSERKTVAYPKFEDNSQNQYSKVLMFFPLPAEPSEEEVGLLFNKCEPNSGNGVTIVQKIER